MDKLPIYDKELINIDKYSLLTTVEEQNVILSYLHPYTPYHSLIVCYQLGSGKTYAAACLSHIYISEGFKVLYMASSINSLNNFKTEYEKVVNDLRFKSKFNQITSLTFAKFYNMSVLPFKKGDKTSSLPSFKKEDKTSKVATPTELDNDDNKDVLSPFLKGASESPFLKGGNEGANKKENYGLIIIDEAHNLRENAKRCKVIQEKLSTFKNAKILVISATPMIDSELELDNVIKLAGNETKIAFSNKLSVTDLKVYYATNNNNEIIYTENSSLFESEMIGLQKENYLKIENDRLYSKARQLSITANTELNSSIPLNEQSAKLYKLIQLLEKNQELTVIFSFYVNYGTEYTAKILTKYLNYTEWSANKIVQNNKKTYAIINGNTPISKVNAILRVFNSLANMNGELISVLIGSSVLNESITLYRVRHVHLLSPFWNFGQINQSIGRVIRFGSHTGLSENEKTLKIYLHSSYVSIKNTNTKLSIDNEMWNVARNKQEKIDIKLSKIKLQNISSISIQPISNFYHPTPNNITIFKINNYIWDLTNCFDKNKYKISWCIVYEDKAIGYNLDTKNIILSNIPIHLKINTPLPTGYTIWRSCIDNRLRISYFKSINDNEKLSIKKNKRGKLIENLTKIELNQISEHLNCNCTISSIIQTLQKQQRFFDKQIEIKNDL